MPLQGRIAHKRYVFPSPTSESRNTLAYVSLAEWHVVKSWCVGAWGCIVVWNFRAPLQLPHVLKLWCMGEWGCIMVWNFRAPLLLPQVIEESVSSLNRRDVWFWVSVTMISCLLNPLWFHAYNSPSSSFTFFDPSRYFFLTMSSFLFYSTIVMGSSDSRGSIRQPLMNWEVISIGGSSSENTCRVAPDSEYSFSERLRVSCRIGGGTYRLRGRV